MGRGSMSVHTLQFVALISGISALLTFAICAYGQRLAVAANLTSKPDGARRLHDRETPLLGGIAILVPVIIITLVYAALFPISLAMHGAIVAAALMLVIGVLDDLLGISPVWRLVGLSFICFGLFPFDPEFILHSLNIWVFNHHFIIPIDPFAQLVTVLIVVGFVNAGNMADGINGQLLGSVLIWSALILHHLSANDSVPFFVLASSVSVGLFFNLQGKLFSGSAGAYAISFLIALGAITAYRSGIETYGELPVLWFWLPVLDCVRLLIARVCEGRTPFSGDRNHIHHLLADIYPSWLALLIYLGILALPGALAEINEHWGKIALLIAITAYAMFVTWRTQARKAFAMQKPPPAQTGQLSGATGNAS